LESPAHPLWQPLARHGAWRRRVGRGGGGLRLCTALTRTREAPPCYRPSARRAPLPAARQQGGAVHSISPLNPVRLSASAAHGHDDGQHTPYPPMPDHTPTATRHAPLCCVYMPTAAMAVRAVQDHDDGHTPYPPRPDHTTATRQHAPLCCVYVSRAPSRRLTLWLRGPRGY
jgi:hypothetical protein